MSNAALLERPQASSASDIAIDCRVDRSSMASFWRSEIASFRSRRARSRFHWPPAAQEHVLRSLNA